MLWTKEKGQGGEVKFKQGLRGLFKRSRDERKDTDKTSEDETFNKPSTSAQQNEHENVTSSTQLAANTVGATTQALNYETKLAPSKNVTADVAGSELLVSTISKNNLDPLFLATGDGQPLGFPQASQIEDISGLWDEAYNALKEKDEDLIQKYEATMDGDVKSIAGSANVVILGHSTVPRCQEMRSLLKKKMDQVKQEERSITLFGKKISVRDLAVPVVGVIRWAKEYVDGVVSPNPYASIAWAGVSLHLPLLLNPSTQSASLDKALEAMSNVIVKVR